MKRCLQITGLWIVGLLTFAICILPWIIAFPGESIWVAIVIYCIGMVALLWRGRTRKDWRSLFY